SYILHQKQMLYKHGFLLFRKIRRWMPETPENPRWLFHARLMSPLYRHHSLLLLISLVQHLLFLLSTVMKMPWHPTPLRPEPLLLTPLPRLTASNIQDQKALRRATPHSLPTLHPFAFYSR